MPKKIRQLLSDLAKCGFIDRGGKGSHRNLVHPKGVRITLLGDPGDDAKMYQVRAVGDAIERTRSEKEK